MPFRKKDEQTPTWRDPSIGMSQIGRFERTDYGPGLTAAMRDQRRDLAAPREVDDIADEADIKAQNMSKNRRGRRTRRLGRLGTRKAS